MKRCISPKKTVFFSLRARTLPRDEEVLDAAHRLPDRHVAPADRQPARPVQGVRAMLNSTRACPM